MQRLTLILPISDMQQGNIMASVVSGNPANMTTFDNSLLTPIDEPTHITHCWQSTGVDDEERMRLALSLPAFPQAIFVFHSNDELMTVESSNSEVIMGFMGQSLSPMQVIEILGLKTYERAEN